MRKTDHEFVPVKGSIVLGPTDDDDIWTLSFQDEQSGETVRVLLPREQLGEMDIEFTGVP